MKFSDMKGPNDHECARRQEEKEIKKSSIPRSQYSMTMTQMHAEREGKKFENKKGKELLAPVRWRTFIRFQTGLRDERRFCCCTGLGAESSMIRFGWGRNFIKRLVSPEMHV
jgi:hypothetical protein